MSFVIDLKIFHPPLPLKDYVHSVLVMEADAGNIFEWQKIVPYGFGALVFHYKDPYLIKYTPDGPEELLPPAFASGPTLRPIWIKPTGKTGTITVNLYPGALWKMLRMEMKEYVGRILDLSDFYGNKLAPYLNQVVGQSAKTDRLQAIFHFLIQETGLPEWEPDEVDLAVNFMRSKPGMIRMNQLSDSLNISMSKLERHFRFKIGFSPKTYSGILRFNQVFRYINNYPQMDLHDVVFLSGYYDQSHFIRDFSRFAGETPRSFFKKENNTVKIYSGK